MVFALGGTRAHATNFVFSTFKGDATSQETLSIYNSTDALNFKLVADTGFSGPSGALRDPSIMKYVDGKYYVAYTDPLGAGCCGKEDHFSIASSSDLVHWTNVTMVKGGVPGIAHVWAPEWFVEGSTVSIIANIDTLNTDSDFKPYVFTALNTSLTSWSGPEAMGIGPNYIDTFALKVGGIYHVFTKNETTRYVEHATGSKLTGPWTFIGKGNWAGWGSGMEGPAVVQLDDGTWRIYLDGQGAVGFLYANSTDLVSWSSTSPLPGVTDIVRHGTVIRDTPVGGGDVGGAGGRTGPGGGPGSGGIGGGPGTGGGGKTTFADAGIGAVGGLGGATGTKGAGGTIAGGGDAGAGGSKGGASGVDGALGEGGASGGGDGGNYGPGGLSGRGGVAGIGGSSSIQDASFGTDGSSSTQDGSTSAGGPEAHDAGCGCVFAGESSWHSRCLGLLLACIMLCGSRRPKGRAARRRVDDARLKRMTVVQFVMWASLIEWVTAAGCAGGGQAQFDGGKAGTTAAGGTAGSTTAGAPGFGGASGLGGSAGFAGIGGMSGTSGKMGTGGMSETGGTTGKGGLSGAGGVNATGGTHGTGGAQSTDGGTTADAGVDASSPPPGTTPPITPRWAFEPWAWEDDTNTRQSTESLITGYVSRQIPVGAVIVDSPWETTYNTLTWDTTRYPSPAAMISGFHAEGVKVVMWLVAVVDTDAPQYQTVKTQHYGVNGSADSTWWKGRGIQIDVTNPTAASWWNGLLGSVLADGIDGWKLDRGADYFGDPIKTASGTISATEFKKHLSADFFDYTTTNDPNAIVLVRPYSAAQGLIGSDLSKCSVGWVGDHDGGFGGIATQLSDIYTSAQMGYGAPGVEVGGYVNPPSKDSLIRYAEFGALTPLMENGGTNGGLSQHLPWYWDAQTVTIYRYFATLHSELGSYNFSYEVDAHLTGKSVIRQSDIAHAQHLLGDQIFASVITTDVTTKSVSFPAGASWIDYWNENTVYAGGTSTQYSAPLAQYPIFIKAGAIIPLDVKTAITGHGDATSAGKTTLAIYPRAKSSFTFHRPTGEGTAYADAVIDVDATSGIITMTGSVATAYRLRVKSMQAPTGVTGADTWSYDAANKVVVIDKQGSAFTITIAGLKGYP